MKTKLNTVILRETIRDINSSLVVSLDNHDKYPNYNSNTESLGYMNKIPQKGFRFVAMIALIVLLSSCSGLNKTKCWREVRNRFPGATHIELIPGHDYTYFVIDKDSTLWSVYNKGIFRAGNLSADSLFSFKHN